jgi:hypothetical protein
MNAASEKSLRSGQAINMSDRVYFGYPAQYSWVNGVYVKVAKGLPYVKAL